jgi:hypothetical protein
MDGRPRAVIALLIAMTLAIAGPVATHAEDGTPVTVDPATATPLNRNLLRNGGFEAIATDGSIPRWTVRRDVHVEKFGTRPWPYPAYGRKYHGGKRYLACSGSSGLVRQTVPFTGWDDRSFWLKAHLQASFGGRIGHAIRVTIRVTGPGIDRVRRTRKPLIITNHYKRAVTWVLIPRGADRLVATVELLGAADGTRCRMAADSVKLIVFRP